MQIKSWQIVQAGLIIQVIAGIILFFQGLSKLGIFAFIFVGIPLIIGFKLMKILRDGSEKNKKTVSVIGIVIGITVLLLARSGSLHWTPDIFESIMIVIRFMPIALFSLATGLYYFIVESKIQS